MDSFNARRPVAVLATHQLVAFGEGLVIVHGIQRPRTLTSHSVITGGFFLVSITARADTSLSDAGCETSAASASSKRQCGLVGQLHRSTLSTARARNPHKREPFSIARTEGVAESPGSWTECFAGRLRRSIYCQREPHR